MTVQDLITEYGAYYKDGGQNIKRILQMPFQPLATTQYFTPMRTLETTFELSQGSVTSILQPFQKKFTPAGELAFKPNRILLNHVKADISIFPDDIEASWLGFLGPLNNETRAQWPLIRYAIEVYFINKINEDRELFAHYKGVYEAPADGVASVPLKSMDGLQVKLQAGLSKGINSLATIGALATETIFDQIEEAVELIDEVYQSKSMGIFVAPKMARAYLREKRSKSFYNIDGSNKIDNTVDFAPQFVVGLPSMIGTTDMFITPKENLLFLNKRSPAAFEIQPFDREVKLLMDWWETPAFGMNTAVWTNLVVPAPPVGG